MKPSTMVVVLVAACNSAPTPPSTPAITPPATTPAKTDTPAPTQPETAPAPAATCIAKKAAIVDARLEGGTLVACYAQDKVDECWRFDLAKSTWSFGMRRPHVDVASPDATVTATTTSARACASDGSDCKTIPLTGIVTAPADMIAASANLDRSIVAVWASGPIHVFDAQGKRLTTIKPWPTPMSGGSEPAFFRGAHVLGSTIEVRISDTPISIGNSNAIFGQRGG